MLLEDLEVILKVAEFRSITAAAESLDMRTATASAAVKRVEKALGVELFIRTTRQLRLSSAGERYLPNCEEALKLLDLAHTHVKDDLDIIDGDLRISASSDIGRNMILPWLDEVMDEHPGIRLKFHVSDSNIDFYRDSIDMALRYGSPSDSNLYGFKICNVPRVLCASPDYLNRYGTPQHPNDLTEHNGLLYQLHDVLYDVWDFEHKGSRLRVKMKSDRSSNDADLVRRWCVAGKGIATKSCLDMSNDLLSGRLVSLMPDYQSKPTELWLVCPSRQSITPAFRLLRDRLHEKCHQVLMSLTEHGVFDQSAFLDTK